MSRTYIRSASLILVVIVGCVVGARSQRKAAASKSPCPDDRAWTGRYRNYVYGFSIVIPRGLKGYWNSARCAPDEKYGCVCMGDHGRFIPLSNAAHIEAFVAYQMEPDWSVVDHERQEISSLKHDQINHEVTVVRPRWFRLGHLHARRFEARFVKNNKAMVIDHIIALHEGVEYELILLTSLERYSKDKIQFERVVGSWRLTPRV